VLEYLVRCLDTPATVGRTFDIGGSEVTTYRKMMATMAECLHLRRRRVMPVPLLTPRLSSLWIHLVTPLSHAIARPLTEGLRNRVVCRDDSAARLMPQRLLDVRESIESALAPGAADAPTAWSDAGRMPGDPQWAGGTVFVDQRETDVSAPASAVYEAFCRVGGATGYYGFRWLWRLRGLLDRLLGGPGLRRGRARPHSIAYGDALDFWRVTGVSTGERLSLRAEMRLPGEAELAFSVMPRVPSGSRLTQTARFKPRGLAGLLYWYAVSPFHRFVFSGMLQGIRNAAERRVA
jgi:hypothetical protein